MDTSEFNGLERSNEIQAVPHGRLSAQGGILGYLSNIEEMDYADTELKVGAKPLYDRLKDHV